MITAAEAKALYDASGAEVTQFLDGTVLPLVKNAAMSGKRTCFVYGSTDRVGSKIAADRVQVVSQAVSELEKLGYSAYVDVDNTPYVPRGLADDNGDGPMYQNYGIHIRW